MQYADMPLPAPGGPAREGALAHRADVGGANGVVHTDITTASTSAEADLNKQVSAGGMFDIPLRGI
jgi:hypothetical protein